MVLSTTFLEICVDYNNVALYGYAEFQIGISLYASTWADGAYGVGGACLLEM
jgi:hypothetical protein